jgi:hypothetical protein
MEPCSSKCVSSSLGVGPAVGSVGRGIGFLLSVPFLQCLPRSYRFVWGRHYVILAVENVANLFLLLSDDGMWRTDIILLFWVGWGDFIYCIICMKHDVSVRQLCSVFRQWKRRLWWAIEIALSASCTKIDVFFASPENGSRAGFRNVVLHLKLDNGQSSDKTGNVRIT